MRLATKATGRRRAVISLHDGARSPWERAFPSHEIQGRHFHGVRCSKCHTLVMHSPRPVLVPSQSARWTQRAGAYLNWAKETLPAASVEHIGSTAVPGLDAKDTVDILVGVDVGEVSAATARLANAGADHEGGAGLHTWLAIPSRADRQGVVHVVERGSKQWERRLRFRDILRSSPAQRAAYLEVKRAAAATFPDWNGYTQAKTDVVQRILDSPPTVLTVGGESAQRLGSQLHSQGVRLNESAESLLSNLEFDEPPTTVVARVHPLAHIGLPSGGTWAEIAAAARYRGFDLFSPTAGPYLRLAMMDQPSAPDSVLSAGRAPSAAWHVASRPTSEKPEQPRGFYLRVVDGHPWLRGYRCDDSYTFSAEDQWVFSVPHALVS